MKYLVLGAGIAGLAYANELLEHGCDVNVYEKEAYTGGLCHSFKVGEFTFDSAVHMSFTNNEAVRAVFDKTEYITHNPLAYNYYNGIWLKHPVINNLYPLSAETKTKLIKSFVERDSTRAINNYSDWLRASYGEEIAKNFYDVYTKKYWTVNSEELNVNWVGNRLNTPNLEKVLMGSYTDDTGNDYYAKEMRYPVNGGYEAFINPLKEGLSIHINKLATEVDMEKKVVSFRDGSKECFDCIASSVPLPELVKITKNVPEKVKIAAKKLKASSISLVSVGFSKIDVPKHLWAYIYDQDVLAARVYSPSLKSANNVPEGCSSLQFEIYHNSEADINEKDILENIKEFLLREYCEEDDIMFMDYRKLPYGNVIFYNGMEADRQVVRDYYEKYGFCDLIGRFGEWEYYWSDQSCESGRCKAEGRKDGDFI